MKDEAVLLQDNIEQVYEISCSRCKINYSVEGANKYGSAQIMVDVGWRKIGARVFCPECKRAVK